MTTAYTSFFDYNKTVAMVLRMRYSKAFHSNCFSCRSVFIAVYLMSDLVSLLSGLTIQLYYAYLVSLLSGLTIQLYYAYLVSLLSV